MEPTYYSLNNKGTEPLEANPLLEDPTEFKKFEEMTLKRLNSSNPVGQQMLSGTIRGRKATICKKTQQATAPLAVSELAASQLKKLDTLEERKQAAKENAERFIQGISRPRNASSPARLIKIPSSPHLQSDVTPSLRRSDSVEISKLSASTVKEEVCPAEVKKATTIVESKEIESVEDVFQEAKEEIEKTIQEIIDSEKVLNQSLRILVEAGEVFEKKTDFFSFVDESLSVGERKRSFTLLRVSKEKEKTLPREGLRKKCQDSMVQLFEHANSLETYSSFLIKTLEQQHSLMDVANIFAGTNYEPYRNTAQVYKDYTSSQRKLRLEEKEKFRDLNKKLLSKEARNQKSSNFDTHAGAPFQRLVRYKLFMEKLIKESGKCPVLQKEHEMLKKALQKVQTAAAIMDSNVRHTVPFPLQPIVAEVKPEAKTLTLANSSFEKGEESGSSKESSPVLTHKFSEEKIES